MEKYKKVFICLLFCSFLLPLSGCYISLADVDEAKEICKKQQGVKFLRGSLVDNSVVIYCVSKRVYVIENKQ